MKKDQKGFTLVEGIIVLAVILLIGGVGYYMYARQNSDAAQTTESAKTNQQTTDKKEAGNSTQKYLDIPEAGVRLALTDSTKDAYYTVSEEGNIYLSIHYFDKLKGFEGCTSDAMNGKQGIAALDHAKVGDDRFGSPWTQAGLEEFPNSKISDTYYWIAGSQAACWDHETLPQNDPHVQKAQQAKKALEGLSTAIEKL